MSLGQPLLTAPGVKPCGTVLDVQVFSPDSVPVAATVPKWDRVWGSVCSICAEKHAWGELVRVSLPRLEVDPRSF